MEGRELYMEQDRAECLNRILESDARHRLIISGPGTGKTYTFGRILENDPRPSLVITLINNLVDDIQADIGNLADVRTFHSFARMLLHQNSFGGITTSFQFFPGLARLISADSHLFAEENVTDEGFDYQEFERALRLLLHDAPSLSFFMSRANYYDSVGFDDSVYRIYQLFRSFQETIPTYNIVMVDEFQDFNPLEVGILQFLESVNPTLIVGDDDQSIYHFRQASPDHLRAKAFDPGYQRFPLPYTTRCTDVIVEAVDGIVSSAQANGLLRDRLQKEFICYLPDKQRDNERYPNIQVARCSVQRRNAPYIPRYIETILTNVPPEEIEHSHAEDYPLALVIGPGHYLHQVYEYFSQTNFDIEFQPSTKLNYSLMDGFVLVREYDDSNLGWRILSEFLLPERFDRLLLATADNETPFLSLLEQEFIQIQLGRADSINRAQLDPQSLTAEEIQDLESVFEESYASLFPQHEVDEPLAPERAQLTEHEPDSRDPKILLTNYNGSKGLSAGFTFILGLEEGIFPNRNAAPSFTEVCQLIVALTRTRKQCHVIHTRNFAGQWNDRSIFLDWIPDPISEFVEVNREYF